jgi:hypothetical protein
MLRDLDMPPPCDQQSENIPPSAAFQLSTYVPSDLQDAAAFDKLHPYIPRAKLVPLGTSSGNNDNVTKLQHICDKRGMQPVFEFNEPHAALFIAKVQVGSQSFQTTNPLPTKKQAKEAVSKLALIGLPNEESAVGTKRKAQETTGEVDRSENWIGILHGKP